MFAMHGSAAVAAHSIDAYACAVVGAETPGQVDGSVALAAAFPAQAGLGQGFVGSPLGHDVDGAAHAAAARRGTFEESVGAAKHVEPLDEFACQVLAGQQNVEPVIRDVVGSSEERR